MQIANKIDAAIIENELADNALNEAALSKRARSFMNLVKSVIGLDAGRLIKLATGKQTGLAEAAKQYNFITEETGQVQTLATSNNYRAVGVTAGSKTYYFLAPKRGQNNQEYVDADVLKSLQDMLVKMKQAKTDGNTSALQAYNQIFLGSAQEATRELAQKDSQGTQQQVSPSGLAKVITPIVVQMAGKDGPTAATMMRSITDEEIQKAVGTHIWDANSITEYARLAWAAVADKLKGIEDDGKVAINSLAQTAVSYIIYKYLHVKAQHLDLLQKKQEMQNKGQQETAKQQELVAKQHERAAKQDEQSNKQTREQEKHERDGEAHQLELEKKAADVRKREAEIEKVNAQAEAAAKRPL